MKNRIFYFIPAAIAAMTILTACPSPEPEPVPVPEQDVTIPVALAPAIDVATLVGEEAAASLVKGGDGTYMSAAIGDEMVLSFNPMKGYDGSKPFARYCNYPIGYNFSLATIPTVPASAPEDIDLMNYLPRSIDLGTRTKSTTVYFSGLPDALLTLDGIHLTPESRIDVTLSLVNHVFTDGTATPTFSVDMKRFFNSPEAEDGVLTFEAPLTKENGYSFTKTFRLDGVAFDPDNYDASKHNVRLDARIGLSGEVQLDGLKTTKTKINSMAGQEMKLNVTVVLKDVASDAMTGKFNATSKSASTTMKGVALPKGVITVPGKADIVLNSVTDMMIPALLNVDVSTKASHRTIGTLNGLAAISPFSEDGEPVEKAVSLSEMAGLGPLFATIPDEYAIKVGGSMFNEVSGTMLIDHEYELLMTPSAMVPLAFGPSFEKTVTDELPIAGGVSLSDHTVEISGEMLNGLPLDADITIVLVDAAGRSLTQAERVVVPADSKVDVKAALRTLDANTEPAAKAIVTYVLTGVEGARALKDSDGCNANLKVTIISPGKPTVLTVG